MIAVIADDLSGAAELAAAAADPLPEPHAGVEYKRHAAGVLVRRALVQAHADSEGPENGTERWNSR